MILRRLGHRTGTDVFDRVMEHTESDEEWRIVIQNSPVGGSKSAIRSVQEMIREIRSAIEEMWR